MISNLPLSILESNTSINPIVYNPLTRSAYSTCRLLKFSFNGVWRFEKSFKRNNTTVCWQYGRENETQRVNWALVLKTAHPWRRPALEQSRLRMRNQRPIGTEAVESTSASRPERACSLAIFRFRSGWSEGIWLRPTWRASQTMNLHRDMSITQKIAWFIAQRVREGWMQKIANLNGGSVEVDETDISGKEGNKHEEI